MILAGLDEAGYGPLLGPLVVGCCAFELNDAAAEAAGYQSDSPTLPCLWKLLRRVVSRKRARTGRKLHINDSKQVYSPGIGLKELERSVLAVIVAQSHEHPPCADLPSFLSHVAPHVLTELDDYIWYRPAHDKRFPIEQDLSSILTMGNALKKEMRAGDVACIHLAARIVLERPFNHLCTQTRNKSNALFSTAAIHLDHLLRTYGNQRLTIVCDRHGGRSHYAPLLRQMFEEWSLQIISEHESRAEYCLTRGGHATRIIFTEKAESQSLSVAMASMLSKYLREALMRRFNAYWRSLLPDLAPTAGYYNDGERFLRDIRSKRAELGVPDEILVRSR